MHKEYFGYMELELRGGEAYHAQALSLNTGRHAILYHAQAAGVKQVYLPRYLGDSVENILNAHNIAVSHYAIDDMLLPLAGSVPEDGSLFVFVNYFGLLDDAASAFAQKHPDCLIDNCHAFFMRPPEGVAAAYSARKFFGVSDGAYLYTHARLKDTLPEDFSSVRLSANLRRIEEGANAAYAEHKQAEAALATLPIRRMSKLTQRILQNVDYEHVARIRRENFAMLHDALGQYNQLQIPNSIHVPMAYPLFAEAGGLREKLVEQRIYVPHLWPESLQRITSEDQIETQLTHRLVLLPIDQRYDADDMAHIIKLVKAAL